MTPIFARSLACRSCRPAYCSSAIPGIPPTRVKSPHGARAKSDSFVVTGVLTSIRTDDEFDGTAILVRDACAKLIEATERTDYGTEFLWTVVAADNPDLERRRVYALADALRSRTEKFDRLVMKAGFRRITIGEARSKLITRLADHFHEKGLKPTAAISYGEGANPSPFVALVILTMASLPEALQESAQGLPAFSRTVSRTLGIRTK